MQASTIQQFAAGLALFEESRREGVRGAAQRFARRVRVLDLGFLERFIEKEAAIYEAGEFVIYETADYGMCVVTDTTERAPTFSLAPFENFDDPEPKPSWAYLSIPGTDGADEAWAALLGRKPRALEWPGIEHIAGYARLLGYDFSARAPRLRAERSGAVPVHTFGVHRVGDSIGLELDDVSAAVDVSGLSRLEEYTLLKIILNTHSTLVMGRLGRYESNVMLWVRPSNYKLIDRATRYVLGLLERDGKTDVSYEATVRELFRQNETTGSDESIVWHTYRALGGTRRRTPGAE
jgi:N-acetylmuramic acid 6-phosphate etherase